MNRSSVLAAGDVYKEFVFGSEYLHNLSFKPKVKYLPCVCGGSQSVLSLCLSYLAT